jgi:hypothetical protein
LVSAAVRPAEAESFMSRSCSRRGTCSLLSEPSQIKTALCFLSISLYLSLFLSLHTHTHTLMISLSLFSLSLSVYIYIYIHIYLSTYIYIYIYTCILFSLSLSIYIYLSLSFSLCLSLCIYMCIYLSLSNSLCLSLSINKGDCKIVACPTKTLPVTCTAGLLMMISKTVPTILCVPDFLATAALHCRVVLVVIPF